MKKIIAAFFSFSRVERLGIAFTAACIVLMLLIRGTMIYWVHPRIPDAEAQSRIKLAYNLWKVKEHNSILQAQARDTNVDVKIAAELFTFDPNTLDSIGFLRLGMPPKALKGLLNWRSKGKHFYKAEDLKPLYNFPAETYSRLAPFIRIADNQSHSPFEKSFANNYSKIPAIIDLNTADSALLDRGINGIGARLAHKIIERRTALGGFISHEQLLEIYPFPDTTFQKLKTKLHIDPKSVHKMNLNTVSLEQMSAHPYIGEKMAKNILLYRQGIKTYQRMEQLREVPLMNEEIYRKIAPYLVVE